MTWLYVLAAVLGFFSGAAATAWLMLVSHLRSVQQSKVQP